MLSLSDLQNKQVLVIQTEFGVNSKISFWNENLRYECDGKVKLQMSCMRLLAVFILGDISLTTVIIQKCIKYGISIFLLKQNFEINATIAAQAEGNVILRAKQYTYGNTIDLAKVIVNNKIQNQIQMLKKHHLVVPSELEIIEQKIYACRLSDKIRGLEGAASKLYFKEIFGELGWKARIPRAKTDYINALLDIGYFHLFSFVDTFLRLFGFDTYLGVYHTVYYHRKSLACDLMEPFRCLIEDIVIKGIHLHQFRQEDFARNNGYWRLKFRRSADYSKVFNNQLLNYREEIYNYIRNFYKHLILDPDQEFKFIFPVR